MPPPLSTKIVKTMEDKNVCQNNQGGKSTQQLICSSNYVIYNTF